MDEAQQNQSPLSKIDFYFQSFMVELAHKHKSGQGRRYIHTMGREAACLGPPLIWFNWTSYPVFSPCYSCINN